MEGDGLSSKPISEFQTTKKPHSMFLYDFYTAWNASNKENSIWLNIFILVINLCGLHIW